jgi:hypothetical protein
MKFPELKFPNTLLTIWWGAAMMAAGIGTIFLHNYDYKASGRLLIFLCILSYFFAIQIFTFRHAIDERKNLNSASLFGRWLKVMRHTHLLRLSALPPLLTLPMIYGICGNGLYVENMINHTFIETLIAPGSYTYVCSRYEPHNLVIYTLCASIVSYLHLCVLAAWLGLAGLLLSKRQMVSVLLVIIILIVGLTPLTNNMIEVPMAEASNGDWGCLVAPNSNPSYRDWDCNTYWTYRNLNRVIESIEYSFYGTLSGGIQFTNELKEFSTFHFLGSETWGRFLRNLVVGLLSPSLQLFFITRYLKKRSFEKGKREYAA